VFDFKEGNGDKFYFPTYSFMEWLPNNSGAKFSFLVTKMKPKPKPPPAADMKPPATPAPKAAPARAVPTPTPAAPTPAGAANSTATPNSAPQSVATPGTTQATPALTPTSLPPATPYVPPPRIEDFDEKTDIKDVEFYQPVTVLVMSGHPDILQSLPRAVRPPDAVDRYMNQVFDTCRRAEETFLAFRLPKEGGAEAENDERKAKSGDAMPVVNTAAYNISMGGTAQFGADKRRGSARPRKSIAA
jgi:hypothetical protein